MPVQSVRSFTRTIPDPVIPTSLTMASLRPLLLVALVLLLPVLPMLAFGGELEAWTEQWIERPQQRQQVAAGVVLLLAAGMVLPVPSSGRLVPLLH